jgi:hypothetical protein
MKYFPVSSHTITCLATIILLTTVWACKGPFPEVGPQGPGWQIVGTVPTFNELENPYDGEIGDVFIDLNTGHGWLWNGTEWSDIGLLQFRGVPGKDGQDGADGSFIGSNTEFEIITDSWQEESIGNTNAVFLKTTLVVPLLTQEVLSSGLILVYFQKSGNNNPWKQLPFNQFDFNHSGEQITETYEYAAHLGKIDLNLYQSVGGMLMNDAINLSKPSGKVRVILTNINGLQILDELEVNLADYHQVSQTFHFTD